MTPTQFRKLALSMPDAVEGAHHDHPDFRANGRVFASLYPDGERGMVKVSLPEQQALVHQHADAFAPASGAWGRAGCTTVQLAVADAKMLRDPMTSAWQLAMAAPAVRARSKAAKKPRKPKA